MKKSYTKEYHKEYYQKIREEKLKYQKEYAEKNKERIKEYKKQYAKTHSNVIKTYNEKNKERRAKNHRDWQHKKLIRFLDKQIVLDNIVRLDMCSCCRYQGVCNLHHFKYDLNDPLKYTTELCNRCHLTWHFEGNYLRTGKRKILSIK